MKAFIKKKTKEFITELLTDKSYLRDNDEKLASNVFYKFLLLAGHDPNKLSAWKLLQMYAEGDLPRVDYITRIRRKIQEQNPDLRGEDYAKNQKHSIKVAKTINKPNYDEVL